MRKLIATAVLLMFCGTVFADALDDAKAMGHVVEAPTGYIQATASAPETAQALVAEINAKRKAAYTRIAKKNNITVEQVAQQSYRIRHGER